MEMENELTSYTLSKEDANKFNSWRDEHYKNCKLKNHGAIGGAIKISFTETTLGTIVLTECACGERLDLTDYSEW